MTYFVQSKGRKTNFSNVTSFEQTHLEKTLSKHWCNFRYYICFRYIFCLYLMVTISHSAKAFFSFLFYCPCAVYSYNMTGLTKLIGKASKWIDNTELLVFFLVLWLALLTLGLKAPASSEVQGAILIVAIKFATGY